MDNSGSVDLKKRSLQLFCSFFKIGLFTFGGGYAMIPLIQKELVEKKKWIAQEDLLDMAAIAEATPGPIAINSATFVGCKINGTSGAVCATLGVVLPSFLIIFGISFVLRQFQDFPVIQYAFRGIRIGVLALILNAFVNMFRQCPKGRFSAVVGAFAFICVAFAQLSVLPVICASAFAGILFFSLRRKL